KTKQRRRERAHRRSVERRCEDISRMMFDDDAHDEVPLDKGNGPPRPEGAFYALFCDKCAWDMVGVEAESFAHEAKCGHVVAHPRLASCVHCAMQDTSCRKCGKPRRIEKHRYQSSHPPSVSACAGT